MTDKRTLVAQKEYGKDEDSTQSLLKKQEAIEQEIEGYKVKVVELCSEGQELVKRDHFDSQVIAKREVSPSLQLNISIHSVHHVCTNMNNYLHRTPQCTKEKIRKRKRKKEDTH